MTPSAPPNGAFPRDARSAASLYLSKGLAPIPLQPRGKAPIGDGWKNLRLTEEDLDDQFPPGVLRNLGILNGEPSGNLTDVDLDCIEALLAAPLLPQTGWIFGRATSRRS